MKESAKHWILIGSFALVLALLAIGLPLLFSKSAPKSSFSETRIVLTPTPKTEEDAVIVRTPAPTPVQIERTPQPVYPPRAVNLLVNGTPIFAVGSREIAEQLVRIYLNECAYENLGGSEILLTASIDAELSTVPANGSVEYIEFDVAMNRLRKNRSLIPVRRTVERVTVKEDAPAPLTERTKLLPAGSRMFRKLGEPSLILIYTETLYKDGLAVSETETLTTPIQAGVAQLMLLGEYRLPASAVYNPDAPNPAEGQSGPIPASLSFSAPIRGKLVGYYGLQTGEMRYGIDYSAAPGTRIVAPESGTILFSGERAGLGYVIEIRHEEGFVSRISFGAKPTGAEPVLEKHVNKGDTVALLPETEGAKESILHYEILIDGIPYNPLFYLPAA